MAEKQYAATSSEARRERVRQTDEISKAILSNEALARTEKTARLKAMRLAAARGEGHKSR